MERARGSRGSRASLRRSIIVGRPRAHLWCQWSSSKLPCCNEVPRDAPPDKIAKDLHEKDSAYSKALRECHRLSPESAREKGRIVRMYKRRGSDPISGAKADHISASNAYQNSNERKSNYSVRSADHVE